MTQNTPKESDGGEEWPDCIQCGSGQTTVVPLTGEWTCETCGRQWTYDEVPEEDQQAEAIPEMIEGMLNMLAETDRGVNND